MQKDSIHCSISGHTMQRQPAPEESSIKSFCCSHCSLVFPSKISLFQHLTFEHGTESDEADDESNGLESIYSCHCCAFVALNQEDLNEHAKQCEKRPENQNQTKNPILPENHESKTGALTSTSKYSCLPNSSKDLKTYKGPLQMQTITKFLTGASRSPSVKSADGPVPQSSTNGTLLLQQSPSDSNPDSSGVLKVTAKSVIDLTNTPTNYCLPPNYFLPPNHIPLSELKPREQGKDAAYDNYKKRSNRGCLENGPTKKTKLGREDTDLAEKKNASKQPPSNTDLAFEFSDDEEEKKVNQPNRDKAGPNVYFCKHCDYSDAVIRRMSFHYQSDHPHIRCSAVYIQDPSDQSVTFRCLECPIEFLAEADLQRHYRENHPDAPKVLMMHSCDLVYKCFVCKFISNELKALTEHYKDEHPTQKADDSLWYCKYTVPGYQDGSSQCTTGSPETSGGISPKNTNTQPDEIRNEPSTLHPTSRGEEVVLYHCSSCNFSHKSAVGMHVHYQKKHPDEIITINKIKQSASVVSQTTCENSSNVTKNSETHPESPKTEKGKSEADREKTKLPSKWERGLTANGSSPSSANRVFYCQFCNFSNANIRSIVAHHNMKHAEFGLTDTEEVWWVNNKLQKKISQSDAKASTSAAASHSKCRERVEVWKEKKRQNEEANAAAAFKTEGNPYECVENLFYCQKCNFANVSLKGIMNHQAKAHQELNANHESIIKHTDVIRAEILKSDAKGSSFRLPLPLMSEGDKGRFFCHFCNYRHNIVTQVFKHYISRHHGFVVQKQEILQYTSTLLKQMEESHPETFASQEDGHVSFKKKVNVAKKVKTLTKCSKAPAPSSVSAAQTQRSLKCYRCTYSTQYVNLLRRHMLNIHRTNRRTTDILRLCYRQGMLESGHHCDWCVFSHQSAAAVFQHIQEQHPKRKISLEYISTRLYVGPDSFIPKKKTKPKPTHGGDGTSGQNKTKMFSCRACSFKGSSMSTITRHCRAVHPWSVKDDGSVLNVITSKKSNAHVVEEPAEIPESFDSYQVPLGHSDSPDSSHEAVDTSKLLKCKYCPTRFSTWHGLDTHTEMKHPEARLDLTESLHVFKCQHCTYINTDNHGVITHCQMRHPDSEPRANSHYMGEMHLRSLNHCLTEQGLSDTSRVSGYTCETCPQFCPTLKKLNSHREEEHNETDPAAAVSNSAFKVSAKLPAARKRHHHSAYSSLGSVSKASLLKKKYSVIKCQLCTYTCSSEMRLNRHMCGHHNNSSNLKDSQFKCSLCPKSYFSKRHLLRHYTNKHGKRTLFKYFAPGYTPGSGAKVEDGKIVVYKCPSCSYVNSRHHGTLTHCQMMHPALVVRAEELQKERILETSVVHCWTGKGSKHKGFMCPKCPQIHASMLQLDLHCEKIHKSAASKLLAETETAEKQPDPGARGSTSHGYSLKIKSSPVGARKRNDMVYKCDMCSYTGICRKYLHCHYKNMHKMDAFSIYKQLERYNKRRYYTPKVPSEERVHCKKCTSLIFDTSQLLIVHYANFHSSDFKMDFTVLQPRTNKTSGDYVCDHCGKHIHGIRRLCRHLEQHEAMMKTVAMDAKGSSTVAVTTTPEPPSNETCPLDEPPMLESVLDVSHRSATPEKTFTLQTGSSPSSSRLTDPELPEQESVEHKHTCGQCGRSFMSLKGLRSHERSHAALAAIKKLDKLSTSLMKHNVNDYIVYKPGTLRPLLCSLCSYRTTVFGLWRSHFIRKHQDVIMNDAETDNEEEESSQRNNQDSPPLSEENDTLQESDEEVEITERSVYLEPPDVQRQLNHYSLMAQTAGASKATVQESELAESCLLHCEFCSFSTGHLSSVRRHYLNRHGKKILRCKDCEFFTGLRKTLEMHMEAGHSTVQSEATQLRDLRCPLCLYQTKNKNSLIDHVVLHREERIVPIEVRRPRLSRYLRGIVFRCQKCTFSSGSAENLRLHMMKHEDIKPYKCRLCYFACVLLSDLEGHLSNKHQVERNHDLVGQVSLDQLDARGQRMPEEEEEEEEEEEGEPLSHSEQHNSKREDVKIKFVTGCNEVPGETRAADPALQLKEACLKQEQETAEGQTMDEDTAELHVGKGNTADNRSEECGGSEREGQTREDNSGMSTRQRWGAAGGGSATHDETIDKKESRLCFKTLQHKFSEIESRAEDEILRHILVMDEGGSARKTLNKTEQERAVGTETKASDNVRSDPLHKERKTPLAQKLTIKCDPKTKKSLLRGNNLRSREDFKRKRPSLASVPVCVQLKTNREQSSGLSSTHCKDERVRRQENVEELSDLYGEMPVLENVYLKETSYPELCCKEGEDDELEQGREDDNSGCKDQDHEEGDGVEEAHRPRLGKGGASEVLCPSVTQNELYTCELCGRSLVNGSDLERHVMRHGK